MSNKASFAYATVTVDLSGHREKANIANYIYRDWPADPWSDLSRAISVSKGEAQPPVLVGTPVEVFDRLRKGAWTPQDVIAVITLGLIGHGHSLATATKIVDQYVRANPLLQSLPSALAIMGMYLVGIGAEEGVE
jgi:hypothetical protein